MIQSLLWEIIKETIDQEEDETLTVAVPTDLLCIKQHAATAEKHVKFLFDRQAASPFIAGIASKTQVQTQIDLKEEDSKGQALRIGQCMMPYARIAETTVKSPFNQEKEDRFFAADVLKKMKGLTQETLTIRVFPPKAETETITATEQTTNLTIKYNLKL